MGPLRLENDLRRDGADGLRAEVDVDNWDGCGAADEDVLADRHGEAHDEIDEVGRQLDRVERGDGDRSEGGGRQRRLVVEERDTLVVQRAVHAEVERKHARGGVRGAEAPGKTT